MELEVNSCDHCGASEVWSILCEECEQLVCEDCGRVECVCPCCDYCDRVDCVCEGEVL